jgi:hypothetical protein
VSASMGLGPMEGGGERLATDERTNRQIRSSCAAVKCLPNWCLPNWCDEDNGASTPCSAAQLLVAVDRQLVRRYAPVVTREELDAQD